MKAFSEMNLNPQLVESLRRMNFINPTDVQEKVIPVALEGKDLIVRAKTGTGKTCAFLIPINQMAQPSRFPEALVIVPTRELALQISDVANKLRTDRRSVSVVYGGASINTQIYSLRSNPGIVIGTPGRIIDLIERNALNIEHIRFLVLDEADTMLDMGFIEDIEFIMSKTPASKQTLLFSATMPQRIIHVAKKHMRDITYMSIGSDEELIVTKIKHYYALCENRMKVATLLAYINQYQPKKALIFVQTQYAASAIYDTLKEQGIDTVLMHGGLTQARREHALREFKKGARFLIATNVAARGIDVAGISDIINFDIPEDPHVYVHRVGRSARMNADGRAFTIVGMDERNIIRDIGYATNIGIEQIRLDASRFAHIRAFKRHDRFRGGYHSDRRGGGNFHRRDERQGYRNGHQGYRDHNQGSSEPRNKFGGRVGRR